jgi:hypothetical protein
MQCFCLENTVITPFIFEPLKANLELGPRDESGGKGREENQQEK